MSAPEVEWVLTQLGSVVGSLTTPLKRVDRDESKILDGSIRSRTAELEKANYVGATLSDVTSQPIGTEYDHSREAVVGVRIEGLTHREFGYVDPNGSSGIPFDNDGGLVSRVRDALLVERTYPNAGGANVTYTDLRITNEAPQSSNYADYYRTDFDVVFNGYEDLP
ncbi:MULTISPECIES: hypothetical protein [Halorussus]|uniref:hypothetical protein n=1 Tax=Halorussus TaxID=1070314 RepID=UPI0020A08A46|nr:hypothetical protein [Halorussus vallis]USZ75664.1 hypothetical protein NGM07_19825 [Halorussus vallis]USZ75719.1 hypothetical protein NGM07_20105 [Halorussus vallis]USZ75737.1 hypothetical protein NGM07_00050 [Halorussus vallis]